MKASEYRGPTVKYYTLYLFDKSWIIHNWRLSFQERRSWDRTWRDRSRTSTIVAIVNDLISCFVVFLIRGCSLRGCRLEIITDQDPCKSDLELFFGKSFNADNFYFYADWRISNNICHFVTFKKSKMTCPFNGNEASRLSYLTGLLTKLPGEHIPLL